MPQTAQGSKVELAVATLAFVIAEVLTFDPLFHKLTDTTRWLLLTAIVAAAGAWVLLRYYRSLAQPPLQRLPLAIAVIASLWTLTWVSMLLAPKELVSHPLKLSVAGAAAVILVLADVIRRRTARELQPAAPPPDAPASA